MEQNLEHVRHSLAHLLAAAVLELYPGTKQSIGPAIDNGFYYDFDFSSPISEEDLPRIEDKMREILKTWGTFSAKKVSAQQAKEFFRDNPYKQELIDEIEDKKETITLYTSGQYTDLCRGGHVQNASEIDPDAFKLSHLAGAYWRGDEKNKQLTRIYGLAFGSKEELDSYVTMMEEAKKRDHKVLGPHLDLFTFSDLVGAGLPLFTPRGTLVRNLLDAYVWDLRRVHGYEQVDIPHITKKDLYERSGHWDKFKDDLFKITTREGHVFALKPMNCPHHTQIYARRQWSYRELPQRYANTTKVYRDEQTGELQGLSRVRSITQDDAHVFCRMSQVNDELKAILNIVQAFYGTFGFQLNFHLSTRDPQHPEKYLGTSELWDKTEKDLADLIWHEVGVHPNIKQGEAAFYGPKLDFMGKDAIGREHQVATIQLDMNQPERFDLTCVNEKGEKERIVMIHAAVMGSIERFLSVLIEHTAGAFPLWLAPVQVSVLPISDKHQEQAEKIASQLRDAGVRVEVHTDNETIGKKIRASETMKIPYAIILGDKDIAAGVVSVRARGGTDLGQMTLDMFAEKLRDEITRKA